MSFEIKGKLVDPTSSPARPLSNYMIKVFDQDPFPGAVDDDEVGKAVTLEDGSFRVKFKPSDFRESWDPSDPHIYFQITNLDGVTKTTGLVTSPYTPFTNPSEVNECEAIVIGSGFGGTITSLSLVNKYVKDAKDNPGANKKKIVILERGQWWVSHELPLSRDSHEFSERPDVKIGIREFLESNNLPYNTWPYPDNINGLSQMVDNLHNSNNRRGLLNYRISAKVHTLTASGVGGGSLIYTNVTEEPHESVIDSWDSKLNIGVNYANLTPFFQMARGFLGVNKIVTNSSMGDVKLPRSKAFHDAARKMKDELPSGTITNKTTFDPTTAGKLNEDIFAADLSITDIPYRKDDYSLFMKRNPLYDQVTPPPPPPLPTYQKVVNAITGKPEMQEKLALFLRKYFEEQNACQRQGRCAVGCIPGARHTNNKKLFDYLKDDAKKEHFEVRALAEVYDIEPLVGSTHKYKIHYRDYGARDKKDISFNGNFGSQSFQLKAILFKYIPEGREKGISCNTLILAAGAIGSTEILLKSISTTRNTGEKLKLSTRLGKGYSTNGDLLGIVTPTKDNIHATRGPMVTSAIRFKEGSNFIYTIEDTGIPKIFAGLSSLLPQANLFRELLVSVGSESINNLVDILTRHLSGISLRAALIEKIRSSMQHIAKEIGEKGSDSLSTPLWDPNNLNRNISAVVHNLGGCSIGKDRNGGVVNNFGKVYKGDGVSLTDTYDDFYVVDGAIIPTSLGVNPSLTISALAFRIAKEMVQSIDFLPVEEVNLGTEKIYFSK
jgi:choline dehydrogenase-like flavoprotein